MRTLLAIALTAAGLALPSGARAQVDPVLPTAPQQLPPADRLPKPPTPEELGLTTPFVEVDRFSDAAGTLLRRSADPTLPKPNEAFSLDDARFSVPVLGPGGFSAKCYDLDVRPSRPNRYYVFYDTLNYYRIGQFPVIEKVPGDPGYSDLWDIWKIVTPDSFRETNWVRDSAMVEKLINDPNSGFKAASTGIYLNAPVVPLGTTASSKAEGRAGNATMLYAWYRGKRAPFLYFEGSLHLTPDGQIPVAKLTEATGDKRWPAGDPASAATWPKGPGYSPLVAIVDAKGKSVVPGAVNCPIVGTATP
jgi:hypothetical protein